MRSPQSYRARKTIKFGGILDVDRDVCYEKEYSVWRDMLFRCHPPNWTLNNKMAVYAGHFVDEAFKHYSDFYAWFHPRLTEFRQLDKDIKERNNKRYSPETCLVVLPNTNKAFQIRKMRECDNTPYGVKIRPNNKFSACCVSTGGTPFERHFSNMLDAHRFWQVSKAKRLMALAEYESSEVKPFVIERAIALLSDAENGIVTIGEL